MKNFDKGVITILICLSLSALFSWMLYFKEYQQRDTVSIHAFPKQIGEWKSKEMPITEEEYSILETKNVFAREYENALGQKVYLLLVYSQNNRKVSHPPEICYTGGGLTILNKEPIWLLNDPQNRLQANKLVLEHGHTRQLAFYWFKIGNTFTANYWQQQVLIALKTIFGQPSSSAMVRISLTVGEGEDEPAIELARTFAQTIKPYLFQYLPAL